MMTYWLVNLPFLLAAALVTLAAVALRTRPQPTGWLVAGLVMVALTAVFDNAIIGFGIVDYDEALISGVRIGVAPLEDFAYTLAAVAIIPALWHILLPRTPGPTP